MFLSSPKSIKSNNCVLNSIFMTWIPNSRAIWLHWANIFIQVTSYVHGATELLGVQIDAAINSGNSGNFFPTFSFPLAFSLCPLSIPFNLWIKGFFCIFIDFLEELIIGCFMKLIPQNCLVRVCDYCRGSEKRKVSRCISWIFEGCYWDVVSQKALTSCQKLIFSCCLFLMQTCTLKHALPSRFWYMDGLIPNERNWECVSVEEKKNSSLLSYLWLTWRIIWMPNEVFLGAKRLKTPVNTLWNSDGLVFSKKHTMCLYPLLSIIRKSW